MSERLGKLIDKSEFFENKVHNHEMQKMKELYEAFIKNIRKIFDKENISLSERFRCMRNTKKVYDSIVQQMIQQGKKPFYEDSEVFFEEFEKQIFQMPVFTSTLSALIRETLRTTYNTL